MLKADQRPECPICIKLGRNEPGRLIVLGPTLTCCRCEKMWSEHEFLWDAKAVGLAYYFKGSINGEVVIYDPCIETHNFIEEVQQSVQDSTRS